jgi:putative ABC transport system ATP-binding protein
MTVVLVTHEHDVARFARRILVFKDGKVVQDEQNEAVVAKGDETALTAA